MRCSLRLSDDTLLPWRRTDLACGLPSVPVAKSKKLLATCWAGETGVDSDAGQAANGGEANGMLGDGQLIDESARLKRTDVKRGNVKLIVTLTDGRETFVFFHVLLTKPDNKYRFERRPTTKNEGHCTVTSQLETFSHGLTGVASRVVSRRRPQTRRIRMAAPSRLSRAKAYRLHYTCFSLHKECNTSYRSSFYPTLSFGFLFS